MCGDDELPVHSFILSTRSPVLDRSVNGDFRESREKKIRIEGFKSSSVAEMIKFLYGFELSEELEDPEELLALADMYQVEGLKQATTKRMMENMNTDNVFKIVEIVGYSSEEFSTCVKFVEENFPLKTLKDDRVLDMCPRLGLELWRRTSTSLDSVVRTFKEVSKSQLVKYSDCFQDSVFFETSSDIMLTGIGVFVHYGSPDLKLNTNIYRLNNFSSVSGVREVSISQCVTTLSNKNPNTNIQRVDFDPIAVERGREYKVSVNISGQGWSDAGSGLCEQVIVDGLNDKGKFVKKVTFTFTDNSTSHGQIPELYFNVNG